MIRLKYKCVTTSNMCTEKQQHRINHANFFVSIANFLKSKKEFPLASWFIQTYFAKTIVAPPPNFTLAVV